ncbi:MAG: AAA family ATPase, partial [Deltaproteobacteria bacterium]|nr:AAA family ATPase [Deltaproteobacteria bacterium]
RYKVFIIDEAHMLTREAFNALLKTLEEPPGHVTFILATTEAEKFPRTIISRCQHYVFKHLSQAAIRDHLAWLLQQEGINAEPSVLNLIARRAAGSVRDGMSFLSQLLAFCEGTLEERHAREVLGLAGQETLQAVVKAIRDRDTVRLSGLSNSLLEQGLDLGFFLRELIQSWRNLFLLGQCGQEAHGLLDLPAPEIAVWQELSQGFSPAHVHACWQVTLEGQRRVMSAPEPGTALEMLLLNLAYLPTLLPIERVDFPGPDSAENENGPTPLPPPPDKAGGSLPSRSGPQVSKKDDTSEQTLPDPAEVLPKTKPAVEGSGTFEGFTAYVRERKGENGLYSCLRQATAMVGESSLVLSCPLSVHERTLTNGDHGQALKDLVQDYFGLNWDLTVEARPEKKRRTREELLAMAQTNPHIDRLLREFDARIIDVTEIPPRSDSRA